ncbi:mariner Mos1 transposase [Trichonephila clavipes]|nr:mariner Mos1 transposase [Trichonephila clavipes]
MEVHKENIRFNLQFFFHKGENANRVAEISNGVYGTDTFTANYMQFWFRRFRLGIFDVKDAPRTGRPVVDIITEIIEVDRHVSSRSLAQELKIDHKTVLSHLRKVAFKKEPHVWELLPHGQTLNSDIYCQQLDRLKLAIDQKLPELSNRRGVVFHQDNLSTYTSVVTHQNLWGLSWEVLMHPPYSPDLVPSDYHLFHTLQNLLSYKKLGSREDYENRLLDVFANKG